MQIYAKEGDLIVTAQVSAGAELMADGHIHVYGPLRGRAMAGVTGNTNARIFCRAMEAELISIAGYYLTKEDMQQLPESHGMIQVYLENGQVRIETIS
jgi:septum site-determining protein MinC